ncbi:flavin-containing monooxygenase-like protein [Aulographum hederae CBS 113979]|uniref:Flavin-containing monooxygenase-like protein n=1 Tax=Aulographum hederae CBS 113979 TaxID=1176131 RepID=A0A6G1HBU7_9PEZI|nr:flavin-containing monooxygenase-like protein [Aulographum hederae CBS 113979]
MAARVAVIGAGALGLMALKNFKEDGFEFTGFETRSWAGGLWKYSGDTSLSVAEKTIFNSSRYRSAISDFPFSDDTDDFPTGDQMHRYLESYCDHFDLRRHIHFNTRVLGMKKEADQWVLEVESSESGKRKERFDKVAVAIGTFVSPKKPTLDGIESFKGTHLHAIDFHDPSRFRDKNVLLLGLHATTQDVALTLHGHAKHVWAAHKNGLVMIPRYDATSGATFDQAQTLTLTFFLAFLSTWFPALWDLMYETILQHMSKKAFPDQPSSWKFSPAPSTAVTPPLIADELYSLLKSGFCEPVSAVKRIAGRRTVELSDGTVLDDVDAIIYCTGYYGAIPFLQGTEYDPYPVLGEYGNLYHGTFPIHPDAWVRQSLAFLGHGHFNFPGFIQSELLAMATSQVWRGTSHIPDYEAMKRWHDRHMEWRRNTVAKQKIKSTFYVVTMPMGDQLRWLDETAGTGLYENFGWFSRKAWSFWWRDREFYAACYKGLFSPMIWRLFDTGKRKCVEWDVAKEQILRDGDAAKRQRSRRLAALKQLDQGKKGS